MLIIGITGGTGSGKTTVVNTIVNAFSNVDIVVISQDAYYKDTSHLSYDERVNINFDHPEAIDFNLLINHLQDLKNGNEVEQPIYSFIEHNRTGKTHTTTPKKIIIVEGILIFSNPILRDLFDVKIFVHADADERLIRRLKRDITERGRDINEVLNRYQTTLKPMHKKFIEPHKDFADLILPNNHHNAVGIDIIKTLIEKQLK